jgi:nucleotide-binding universal stress UspA family protein
MAERRRNTIFRKILVGFDGSTQSQKAADLAIALARATDASVLVFAVARPPEPATSVELEAVIDEARQHYEDGFKSIVEKAHQDGVELTTEVAVGHPAEQIIHKAETAKADLVILGRRGTSMFEKWILGSISERVLRYAHCPVMVVR